MTATFHSIDRPNKGPNGQYVLASFLESNIAWGLSIQNICIDAMDILKLNKVNGSY